VTFGTLNLHAEEVFGGTGGQLLRQIRGSLEPEQIERFALGVSAVIEARARLNLVVDCLVLGQEFFQGAAFAAGAVRTRR
jgi:hypothetical protein